MTEGDAWIRWDQATKVGRFNIFTDMEIGHLYAVLRPGRMLAEVTAEIERRRKYYEDMPVEANLDSGVKAHTSPLSQPIEYSFEDTPLRKIDWNVERKGRGYPHYGVRCECGWTLRTPSAVVAKRESDAHTCYSKICKHGLTPAMGCCICTDNDYAYMKGTS